MSWTLFIASKLTDLWPPALPRSELLTDTVIPLQRSFGIISEMADWKGFLLWVITSVCLMVGILLMFPTSE